MATEDKSSPSFNQMEKILTQQNRSGRKNIVEFDDTGHSKISVETPPRKTLWDWTDLSIKIIGAIAIPLTVIGLILNVNQFNTQQSASAQMQATQEAASAGQSLDQQHQATLDTYLDRMSDLLLTYHLAASKAGDQVQALAQARTYTALRNLDGPRKGTLVRFLFEANLINGPQPIISLQRADLSGVVLTDAILSGANLSGANLSGANLSGADLLGVDFTGANLSKADLLYTRLLNVQMDGVDLSGAYVYWWYTNSTGSCGVCAAPPSTNPLPQALSGANINNAHLFYSTFLEPGENGLAGKDLSGAPLEGADLRWANLSGADLSGADLSGANLSHANLSDTNPFGPRLRSGANLSGADLSGANLNGTDLSHANLSHANLSGDESLTQQQLDKTDSCLDATLPSGLTCLRTPSLRTLSLIDLLKYLFALAFVALIGYYVWKRGILPRVRGR
jgi:uncharacterized protein YjbI with pentapeptide repeats